MHTHANFGTIDNSLSFSTIHDNLFYFTDHFIVQILKMLSIKPDILEELQVICQNKYLSRFDKINNFGVHNVVWHNLD